MDKVVVILGPTGVGKTDVAIQLAKKINGEVISADSSQVYKGLDIGSAKVTPEEMECVPHHLIDILEPEQEFNVALFKDLCLKAIEQILKNGKTPIICGGTGLYVKALIEDYDFFEASKDQELRNQLNQILEEKGKEYLYDMLLKQAPEKAQKISVNDTVRVIRALEILNTKNKSQVKNAPQKYEYVVFALNMDRQTLYERINRRVDIMESQGLFDEVERLIKRGINTEHSCFKSIGYKEVYEYFKNNLSKQETLELIKKKTRNYAKRQLTWLRGMKNIIWIDNSDKTKALNQILNILQK